MNEQGYEAFCAHRLDVMNERVTCSCGQLSWPAGVLSIIQGDVQHFPDLICVALDGQDAIYPAGGVA